MRGRRVRVFKGEANDMDEAERIEIMSKWRISFWKKLEELNLKSSCVYNADQTGLFHNKMPNRLYVNESEQKTTKGVKQMKSKDRVTLMICTAADGTKVPLSIIGKANKPECFRLCENDKVPLAYKGQRNAWFDKEVTMWWLLHVFWPHHLRVHGDVPCLLLLDNASVQTNLDLSLLPANLHMMYFPPNVTNTHQPADMGMIARLKVGYKLEMLQRLVAIFDLDGGFQQAAISHGRQQRGCKGLAYGGKAHILDAMDILDSGKYAYNDSIQ